MAQVAFEAIIYKSTKQIALFFEQHCALEAKKRDDAHAFEQQYYHHAAINLKCIISIRKEQDNAITLSSIPFLN